MAGHYGKTTRLGAGGGHRNFLSTTHGTSRAERLGRVVPHPKSERRNRLVLSRRAGRLGHTLTQNLVDCAHFPPQGESSVFQDQVLRPPERAGPYTRSHSATQPLSLSLSSPQFQVLPLQYAVVSGCSLSWPEGASSSTVVTFLKLRLHMLLTVTGNCQKGAALIRDWLTAPPQEAILATIGATLASVGRLVI